VKLSIAFTVDSVPFTRAVVDGQTSLGGSESAMLGLARALAQRGHTVHILATKLADDAMGVDRWGVTWIPYEQIDAMNAFYEWDVLVALRHPLVFGLHRKARLRVLWNQDLLDTDSYLNTVMSVAWALDKVVYVSEYHRTQWEDRLPELKALGSVTRNGFDPAHVPAKGTIVKDPNRIIHISRPERGLAPLLEMWPTFKRAHPHAELHLCRYSSMYDQGPGSWSDTCAMFDRHVARVNEDVGGITYLGELNKAQLFQAIADAAVMWYPGVATFAETSCIAAVEAQANGTPFVGSWRGALPETNPSAILIEGDPFSKAYQEQSMAAVARLLDGCFKNSFDYRRRQNEGLAHVESYTYAAIAVEWERWIEATFRARYEANTLGVLRQLLHYDDHAAAKIVAREIATNYVVAHGVPDKPGLPASPGGHYAPTSYVEAVYAEALCDRVIRGEDQVADDYAARALDPLTELHEFEHQRHGRMVRVVEKLKGATRVLDVACGSGAFALGIARTFPDVHVTAVDYAEHNIAAGKAAAEQLGIVDRITWICEPVWDYNRNGLSDWFLQFAREQEPFDAVWCGEFIEHVGDTQALIAGVESVAVPGAAIVLTCPQGPLSEYLERHVPYNRGHVHCFGQADLSAVFGKKQGITVEHLPWGFDSPRGSRCGQWLISYQNSDAPAGERPYAQHVLTTRPKATLSIGIIAANAEHDITRCLDSIWPIADEIVIGNAGGKDRTVELAQRYATRKIRIVDVTAVADHPDGFSGVRNEVLAQCTGDWHLWIDTDEQLIGTGALWHYLESGPFLGYSIHQNHLQLDAPNHYDKPIRLFKRTPDVQFYGCVHEQPQQGDCNGDIHPSLEVFDVQIAHTGYLTHTIRRRKMLHRNLPLLEQDQQRFPDRELGKLLVLRDYINLADMDCEIHRAPLTPRAKAFALKALALFVERFDSPSHKLHDLARPFYERALQLLELGTEMEFAFAGRRGGLQGSRAKPQRFWVRSPEEMQAIVHHHVDKAAAKMRPVTIRLDPIVPKVEPEAVAV
jgi:2-polyprenyl-3-methyl-5-hydroxy-6-metoxy-1,4-benzoquinol methylase/glycosyltransferase involved in cell wall biosynthesis